MKVVIDLDVPDDVKAANRLWKIRPMMEAVRPRCFIHYRCRDVSVDEQINPFRGMIKHVIIE